MIDTQWGSNGGLIGAGAVAGGIGEIGGHVAFTIAAVTLRRSRRRAAIRFAVAGGALAATLVVFGVGLAPLNARIAGWTSATIAANWRDTRNQWEVWHAATFGLSGLALVVSLVARGRSAMQRTRNARADARHRRAVTATIMRSTLGVRARRRITGPRTPVCTTASPVTVWKARSRSSCDRRLRVPECARPGVGRTFRGADRNGLLNVPVPQTAARRCRSSRGTVAWGARFVASRLRAACRWRLVTTRRRVGGIGAVP